MVSKTERNECAVYILFRRSFLNPTNGVVAPAVVPRSAWLLVGMDEG